MRENRVTMVGAGFQPLANDQTKSRKTFGPPPDKLNLLQRDALTILNCFVCDYPKGSPGRIVVSSTSNDPHLRLCSNRQRSNETKKCEDAYQLRVAGHSPWLSYWFCLTLYPRLSRRAEHLTKRRPVQIFLPNSALPDISNRCANRRRNCWPFCWPCRKVAICIIIFPARSMQSRTFNGHQTMVSASTPPRWPCCRPRRRVVILNWGNRRPARRSRTQRSMDR